MSDRPDADLDPLGASLVGLYGFPERAFVVALRNGWAWFKANSYAWKSVLRDLGPAEVDRTIAFFATNEPVFRTGYPTDAARVMQVTVVVEEESPQASGGFLGDVAEPDFQFLDDGQRVETLGEVRSQKLSVSITTDHPDVCLYLYRATGSILTAHKDWLVQPPPDGAGLQMAEWTSGGAVIPDPRNPERLWGRQHRWNVSGIDGATLPIPPPPSGILVHMNPVLVDGVQGRVEPT